MQNKINKIAIAEIPFAPKELYFLFSHKIPVFSGVYLKKFFVQFLTLFLTY